MNEFISTYWASILIALAIVAVCVVLALRGKKQIIYKMLYVLIDEAEENFGSGTGKVKFSYVLEAIYDKLPSVIKVFVTYSTLEQWIEDALVDMKEYWKARAEITE